VIESEELIPPVDSIWKCYNGRYYQVVGHLSERQMRNGIRQTIHIILSREVAVDGNPIAPYSGVHRRALHAWNQKNKRGRQKYTPVELIQCQS
jgi:hypothetical protein